MEEKVSYCKFCGEKMNKESTKCVVCGKENREALRKSIIKVKKGQIVQVIWKIQLGSVDQFGGIDALYPGKVKKYWRELPTRKTKEI